MISAWTFGTLPEGRVVTAYQLTSESGFRAVVLDYGVTLQALYLPDGRNVTLGHDSLDAYLDGAGYRGAIIGPNANRIVGASFEIDGQHVEVSTNDGENNLHSGDTGFHTQIWNARIEEDVLIFSHTAQAGTGGFPGHLSVTLRISFRNDTLRLEMRAETNAPTPVNLTWHPYWNLNGRGRIDGHDLSVSADNRSILETAQTVPVKETRFDFRKALPLGHVRLDDNFKDVKEARLKGHSTELNVTSSLPDMQVYTGDALSVPRSGVALEPQFQPNDINLDQRSLLRPGEVYDHWIAYRFDI